MKRIWNKIGGNVKNGTFLKKAVDHVEVVEKGGAKVVPPKYPTEKKVEATEEAKAHVDAKYDNLVSNMNKIKISSTNPDERWTSTKALPTRESEWLHRNDPAYEYGFYEPPTEKIPKEKLTFREALEVLRARQQLEESSNPNLKQQASDVLSTHAAISRVNSETLDDIYEYFRPFERKDTQKVVNKHELAELQDHLQGHGDKFILSDGAKQLREELKSKNSKFLEEYNRLEDGEKEKLREAMLKLRQEEHERLNRRLAEIGDMEKMSTEATKKALENLKKDKSNQK